MKPISLDDRITLVDEEYGVQKHRVIAVWNAPNLHAPFYVPGDAEIPFKYRLIGYDYGFLNRAIAVRADIHPFWFHLHRFRLRMNKTWMIAMSAIVFIGNVWGLAFTPMGQEAALSDFGRKRPKRDNKEEASFY